MRAMLAGLSLVLVACGSSAKPIAAPEVAAQAETDPVPSAGDAADDPAFWLHPTDPGLSLIIADDKQGGLLVYDLAGAQRQLLDPTQDLNNVDVRCAFPLLGSWPEGTPHDHVDLVVVQDESADALRFYKIDASTRLLVGLGAVATGRDNPYGGCLLRREVDGFFYAIVAYKSGWIEQWRLEDNGLGGVEMVKVRQFAVGSQCEGCVADDHHDVLYIGEEARAIWRYPADPAVDAATATATRVAVARAGPGFRPDVEGLCMYQASGGAGYLIASSQGDDSFRVFDRTFAVGQANAVRGVFRITAGIAADGTEDTDGIEVVSQDLGGTYAGGLFIAQDGRNTTPGNAGNQNFKLVSWAELAAAFSPPLVVDTSVDPRLAVPSPPSGGG